MSDQWFEHFFSGIVNDCWRKCISPEGTRAEVDFLEKILGRRAGDRLLDVPCGAPVIVFSMSPAAVAAIRWNSRDAGIE
jgi:hypothetical protein